MSLDHSKAGWVWSRGDSARCSVCGKALSAVSVSDADAAVLAHVAEVTR